MMNILIYQVFECITVVFETFLIYQYLSGLFERRNEHKNTLLWYTSFCIILIFLTLFSRKGIALISLTVFGLYIISLRLYKSNIPTRVFSVLYFAAIMVGTEIFTPVLISGIWKINLSDASDYGLPRVLCIVVAKQIQIFLVKISVYLARWKTTSETKGELKMMLPLLLCQFFSVMLAHFIFSICYQFYNAFEPTSLIVITGMMYINIVIFWYFDRVKAAFEYKSKSEAAELKLKLQKQYHEILIEHQQKTDALWHDMKKHIALMKTLINNNQHKITTTYIQQLELQMSDTVKIVRTEFPILSALLTEQKQQAKRAGVPFEINVRIETALKIEPVDLCVILGNLFDNALEACMQLSQESNRYLQSSICQRHNAISIIFENTYFAGLRPRRRSSKRGFGLKNVRQIVNKYNGQIDFCEDGEIYKISIIIP